MALAHMFNPNALIKLVIYCFEVDQAMQDNLIHSKSANPHRSV